MRPTSALTLAGWYYVRYLVKSFAYLDLVLQDTPINKPSVVQKLTDSVHRVDNMSDREDQKIDRVRARFTRVESFLDYLQDEEDSERAHFDLYSVDSPIAEPILQGIREQFEHEKSWIERRLKENREKIEEEILYKTRAKKIKNSWTQLDETQES